jgi:hypothetical protein
MRNTTDIPVRLRAANPVPGLPAITPPSELLARITSVPREQVRRRSALIRRPLLVACVALLVACGIALAANISVRYFDDPSSESIPPAVTKALEFAVARNHPLHQLRLTATVNAYVFTTESGSGKVYMSPYVGGTGFCAALAVPGKSVRAGCMPGGGPVASVSMSGFQPWNFAFTPDIHALLGRLSPSAAGSSVEVAFEDRTNEKIATHGRWFAYAVAGERTRAGHRPIRVRVIHSGSEIWHEQLNPANFNTLATARALVPAGDGSPGQEAVRRMLLADIESRRSDGGDLASHTELRFTRLVGTMAFAHAPRLSLYATPVSPLRTWMGKSGFLLVGIAGRSPRPVVVFSGQTPTDRHGFSNPGNWFTPYGCVCQIPGYPKSAFVLLTGFAPGGASRVSVRTADRRERDATIFDNGLEWAWLGRDDPAPRPVALIGRDASGAIVARQRLHGRGGFSH